MVLSPTPAWCVHHLRSLVLETAVNKCSTTRSMFFSNSHEGMQIFISTFQSQPINSLNHVCGINMKSSLDHPCLRLTCLLQLNLQWCLPLKQLLVKMRGSYMYIYTWWYMVRCYNHIHDKAIEVSWHSNNMVSLRWFQWSFWQNQEPFC